jgi:hypothetical protein
VAQLLARWPFDPQLDMNAGGLRRSRTTVNLTLRLLGRAYESSAGGVRPGNGPSMAAVAAFAAGDVVMTGWLDRTPDAWLVPRLVVDALDQAWWSRRFLTADRVIIAGAPLAAEAGIGLGAAGFAVPVINYVAIWLARRRCGLRTSPFTMTAQVGAVGLGAMVAWFARRHDRDIVDRAQADAEAQRTAGYVAGQNAVAAGADSVVDLLARTEPLLTALEREAGRRVGSSGTGTALHAWKAQLAAVTSDRAAYLGTVLRSWERARQSPDLRADVLLVHDASDGTTVVTEHQAADLRASLDGLGLVGDVPFSIDDPVEVRRPGRAFVARVGVHSVTVVDDPTMSPPAFDPVPLMIAAGGLSVATTAAPVYGGTPPWMALAGTSAGLGVAWWVRTRRVQGRPVDVPRLIDLLLGLHCVTASGIVATRRTATDPGGRQLLPQADGFLVSAMLIAGFISRQLDPSQGAILIAKAAASVTPPLQLAGALAPRHVRFGVLVPAASFVGTRGMFRNVEVHRDEIVAEWSRAAAIARDGGYGDGRRSVIELVRVACADARHRIESLPSEAGRAGDARLLVEAERRLVEAEHQLAAINETSARDRANGTG